MPTLLKGGKVKHLPLFELTLFRAIATYQLAFVYLKRKISVLHRSICQKVLHRSINFEIVMHEKIYVRIIYTNQISTTSTKR